MILRSGKIVTNQSSVVGINTNITCAFDDEMKQNEDDYISRLPDELLTHILSLLPYKSKETVRTCILSKRWKHLWVFVPNLRFKIGPSHYPRSVEIVNKFYDSVDKALALRDSMSIQRFSLRYYSDEDENYDYNRVYNWLRNVVIQCKVQHLDLTFSVDKFRFCWDLFKNCNTLVALTLKGDFLLDVPEVMFPSLKKLTLKWIKYNSGEKSFMNLIFGCPVLEELYLKRYCDGFDNLFNFSIYSSSLKRLKIYFNTMGNGKCAQSVDECEVVVIDTPKLEHIHITDHSGFIVLSTPRPLSCLIEAHVDVSLDVAASQAFICVSHAKIVTVTYDLVECFWWHGDHMGYFDYEFPMFPYTVKLVIGMDGLWQWDILFNLLNNMPNLEEIAFPDGFLSSEMGYDWDPPAEAPPSLSYNIKKITIVFEKHKEITSEALALMKYMLQHAKNLEALTINARNILSKTQPAELEIPSWLTFK